MILIKFLLPAAAWQPAFRHYHFEWGGHGQIASVPANIDRTGIASELAFGLGVRLMTSDLEKALRAAHRANIDRCRRLLQTRLTNDERQFVEQRIAEEDAELQRIVGENAFGSVG